MSFRDKHRSRARKKGEKNKIPPRCPHCDSTMITQPRGNGEDITYCIRNCRLGQPAQITKKDLGKHEEYWTK